MNTKRVRPTEALRERIRASAPFLRVHHSGLAAWFVMPDGSVDYIRNGEIEVRLLDDLSSPIIEELHDPAERSESALRDSVGFANFMAPQLSDEGARQRMAKIATILEAQLPGPQRRQIPGDVVLTSGRKAHLWRSPEGGLTVTPTSGPRSLTGPEFAEVEHFLKLDRTVSAAASAKAALDGNLNRAREALVDVIRAYCPTIAAVEVADGYAVYFIASPDRVAAMGYGQGEGKTLAELPLARLGSIAARVQDEGRNELREGTRLQYGAEVGSIDQEAIVAEVCSAVRHNRPARTSIR